MCYKALIYKARNKQCRQKVAAFAPILEVATPRDCLEELFFCKHVFFGQTIHCQ